MILNNNDTIKTIEKIPNILNLFKNNNKLTLHEIYNKTPYTKTSVARLCNSLVNIGLLDKYQGYNTPYYRLGLNLYHFGMLSINGFDLQEFAKKHLFEISKKTEDNSYLFITKKRDAICVHKESGNYYIPTNTTNVGDSMSYDMGGGPKAILAFLPKNEQESIISSLSLSEKKERELRNTIKTVQFDGFATSFEEFALKTGAIGVPVFNINQEVVGALSVGGIID